MASARHRRREKQFEELTRETAKLHQDVEDMEAAVFLHRQVLQEEENSVRGMIRKEVGGSRWKHGGVGKLTTYKSNKDLQDADSSYILAVESQTRKKPVKTVSTHGLKNGTLTSQTNTNIPLKDKTKANAVDICVTENQQEIDNGDRDKIHDLKTRVLKKANTNVIRRDSWHSPVRQIKNKVESVSEVSNKTTRTPDKLNKRSVKARDIGKPKSESHKAVLNSDNHKVGKIKDKKSTEKVQSHTSESNIRNANVIADEIHSIRYEARQSRRDLHDNNRIKSNEPSPFIHNGMKTDLSSANVVNETNYGHEEKGITKEPGIIYKDIGESSCEEGPEIFIDPNTAQIHVKYGGTKTLSDYSRLEKSVVNIKPELSLQPDAERDINIPQTFKVSILDKDQTSHNSPDIKDMFGLQDVIPKTDLLSGVKKSTASLSPLALTKECDTEVEFWLRGLGLADVEDYVEMFAENEIDLLDLEFMSVAQLQDMGVTDIDALNKLLKGVRELRNLPPDKVIKNETSFAKRGLQASSIAWEDPVMVGRQDTTPRILESHRRTNKTFNKGKGESLKSQNKNIEIDSSRSDSILSNYSSKDTNSQSKVNSKNQKSPGTNAQGKPGDKNQNSQPASARTNASSRLVNGKSDKLPPSSKSQPLKRAPNQSNKKLKTGDSSADNKSRLQALEAKPTRSVLLKRSASLTRETGRDQGQNRNAGKGQEEVENKRPAVRRRSRSAEAVKRKALEGVNAAAKRHEERQMKDKESEETKNRIQEKKRAARDEMAARHLQREKNRAAVMGDTDTLEHDDAQCLDDRGGFENLVTLNVLSHSDNKETAGNTTDEVDDKSKARVAAPVAAVRKSIRRIEPSKKSTGRTVTKPVDRLEQPDYAEVPFLSTYKLDAKTREGPSSEPESGYRTETSTSYSQVEEKVAEIQLKIKRLKSRATSGDDVTLTLVKDLQTELQHFEKLLIDKERAMKQNRPDRTDVTAVLKENPVELNDFSSSRYKQSSSSSQKQQHKSLPRNQITSAIQPNSTTGLDQESTIENLLIEDSVVKGGTGVTIDTAAMSMSKKELLDEMRKEKHQHHRQIRQLQSELKRMRETDAASTLELNHSDIVYREEDLVGEGAFSKVFRGTFQGTEVAIKRLVVPLAAQDRNYFAAEVSLLRELRHPRVVLLIGVCTSEKLPVMVLEYMSRGSLFTYLHNAQNKPLDHAEYYQVARDIALGMNYLHSHKPEVLHLDLKSGNVLLCQSFRAKIADFGFSKLRHDATAKLTKKGKPRPERGSPSWMAPELVEKGEITGKADVYSFAIILWEMLTRKLPYENMSVFQVLEMVRKNKRPEFPASSPEALRQLISHCWDQNPAKRPQFKDIISMLENLAFPPAWRELFHKAGVPEEALHNIESTRTLINIVTTTLDSNPLSSFMIPDSNEKDVSAGETTSVTSEETCIPRRGTVKDTDDWESGTVSDISEISTEIKSEFSLGILRDSSDESVSDSGGETITANYGDESSELSSDDSNMMPVSSQRKSPHKKINVFVPNLQLSVKSPDTEPVEIEGSKFDWVSISLDDRTSREDGKNYRTGTEEQFMDLNLSGRSSRIVTPVSPVSSASPKPKERKSWQEKAKEMDEFLMRESINNRRPSSPIKKRLSLTKKLAERTTRSLDTDSKIGDRYSVSDRPVIDKLPYTDRSHRPSLNDSSDLTSLNKKLEELNAKSLDPILQNSSEKTFSSNGRFRRLRDSYVHLVNPSTTDEPLRVTLKESTDLEGEKATRNVSLSNDKSYESFYGIPVNNYPATDGTFRKSEISIPRSGSFTKSKDVLDLLASQIKHTTKTLEDMEKEPAGSVESPVINRNSNDSAFRNLSSSIKQSKDYVDSSRKTTNSKIKLPPRPASLEDYHKFLQQEILHDSGGSIENLKNSVGENQNESDSTPDKAKKTVQQSEKAKLDNIETNHAINDEVEHTEEFRLVEKEPLSNSIDSEEEKSLKEVVKEKESIRVKLNPSDVVSKRPVKTPRRSKMKEISNDSELNADRGETKNMLSASASKTDARSNVSSQENSPPFMSMKGEELSEDEAVRKLKELENFEKSVAVDGERSMPLASENEIAVKHHAKDSKSNQPEMNKEISIETNNSKGSDNKPIPNKTDKLRLLPTEERWTRLQENQKETDSVKRNLANRRQLNTDDKRMNRTRTNSETKNKGPLNINDKSKISEKPQKTIRVKLKKDPLKPLLSNEPTCPVPPAPPPPPVSSLSMSTMTFSRTKPVPQPAASMADELKLRVESWQSRSYQKSIVKSKHDPLTHKSVIQSKGFPVVSKKLLDSVAEDGSAQLEDSLEDFELSDDQMRMYKGGILLPLQSDGLPAFTIQSVELRDQKDHLKSTSKPHPDQLDDLSHVSKEQLSSIADLLRKAVSERRLALGEDSASVEQSIDSVSWSVETTPRP